jgi:hypothetical protein
VPGADTQVCPYAVDAFFGNNRLLYLI